MIERRRQSSGDLGGIYIGIFISIIDRESKPKHLVLISGGVGIENTEEEMKPAHSTESGSSKTHDGSKVSKKKEYLLLRATTISYRDILEKNSLY